MKIVRTQAGGIVSGDESFPSWRLSACSDQTDSDILIGHDVAPGRPSHGFGTSKACNIFGSVVWTLLEPFTHALSLRCHIHNLILNSHHDCPHSQQSQF